MLKAERIAGFLFADAKLGKDWPARPVASRQTKTLRTWRNEIGVFNIYLIW